MEGYWSRSFTLVVLFTAFLAIFLPHVSCVIDIATNDEGVIYQVAVDSKTLTAVWAFTYEGDYVVQSTGILQLSPEIETVLYGPDHTPSFLGLESNSSTLAVVLSPNTDGSDNSSAVVTSSIFNTPATRVQTTVSNYLQGGKVVAIDVSDNNAIYVKRTSSADQVYQTLYNGTSNLLDEFPLSSPNTTRQLYVVNPRDANLEALYVSYTSDNITLYIVGADCTRVIATEAADGHLLATTTDLSLNVIVYLYQTRAGDLSLKTASLLDCSCAAPEDTIIYTFGCLDIQEEGTTLLKVNPTLDEAAFTLCTGGVCTLETVSLTNNDSSQVLATTSGQFFSLEADEAHGRWVWSYQSADGSSYSIQSSYASAYGISNVTSYTGYGTLEDVQVFAVDSRVVYLVKNPIFPTTVGHVTKKAAADSWSLVVALNEDLQSAIILDTDSGDSPNGFSLDRVSGYIVYGVPGVCSGFQIRAVRIPGATTQPNLSGDNNYKSSAVTEMQGNQLTINLYFSGVLNGLSDC